MFKHRDPYAQIDPYAQKAKKRLVIIIGAVIGVTVIGIILALSGHKQQVNQTKVDNMKRFSNGSFAISYPQDFIQVSGDEFGTTATFSREVKDQELPDAINVSRYSKLPTSIDSLEKLASKTDNTTTERKEISNRNVLVTNTKVEEDGTPVRTQNDFYVYADLYVWHVEFSYVNGSSLEKYVNNVMLSFYPKDEELLKL